MAVKLTKKTVERLSYVEKGQKFVWDKNLIGFGLRVTNSRKTYIVQARVKGKTRRVTVGTHGVITAEQARDKALKMLFDMAEGKDPVERKRKSEAAQITLKQAADAYREQKRTKRGHPLKESSKNDIARHVRTTFEDWENKPLADITRDMVYKKYQKALKRSEAQAVQGFRIFRAIYNWQRNNTKDKDGIPTMPENPCAAITDNNGWAYIPSKDRMIPLNKVGEVWALLKTLRDDPGQTVVGQTMVNAVMFAMITGARWGEVAPLKWTQIDFEMQSWTIDDPKNRRKITFPLSQQAIDILQSQANKDKTLVFPGRGKNGHIYRPGRLMKKITDSCGVTISPHDLRRTFNAIAENCNIEFWKQKVLLGHTVTQDVTLCNYKQTNDLTRLLTDIQKISDWITEQAKIYNAENVIDLQAKRKAKANEN